MTLLSSIELHYSFIINVASFFCLLPLSCLQSAFCTRYINKCDLSILLFNHFQLKGLQKLNSYIFHHSCSLFTVKWFLNKYNQFSTYCIKVLCFNDTYLTSMNHMEEKGKLYYLQSISKPSHPVNSAFTTVISIRTPADAKAKAFS